MIIIVVEHAQPDAKKLAHIHALAPANTHVSEGADSPVKELALQHATNHVMALVLLAAQNKHMLNNLTIKKGNDAMRYDILGKNNANIEKNLKGKKVCITLNDNSVINEVVVVGFLETPYATPGYSISHFILSTGEEIQLGRVKYFDVY